VLAKLLSRSDMVALGVASAAGSGRMVGNSNVLARLRNRVVRPGRLLGVFASLVGSQLGGGVLGLVFWTLVARALTPEQVGVGAALVAAMTLLSTLGVLGIGTLLMERFKVVSVTDRRALLSTGLGIAGMGGALVAAGWLGLSALAHLSGVLGNLSLSSALLLVGTTGIAATCYTFDQAVIAMGVSSLQLRRNLTASIVRIAVFAGAIALDVSSGQAVLVSWTVGLVGSLLATPLRRHLPPRARVSVRQRWQLVRKHWPVAIGHHSLTLAVAASSLTVPVIVASLMPATETAYFNQASLMGGTLTALPYLLALALFATVENVEGFRRKAPRTLIMGMALALSIILAGALFGHVLLLMFGGSYSQRCWPLLLLILATGPAVLIKDHFVVLRRLQGMRRRGAATMALWSVAELTGAVVGGLVGGVTLLCVGFVAMSTACALIALPVILKAMRRQPTGDELGQSGQTKSHFNTCPAIALPCDAGKARPRATDDLQVGARKDSWNA
jgi:O-antigen/teichoic acid export membrane protein